MWRVVADIRIHISLSWLYKTQYTVRDWSHGYAANIFLISAMAFPGLRFCIDENKVVNWVTKLRFCFLGSAQYIRTHLIVFIHNWGDIKIKLLPLSISLHWKDKLPCGRLSHTWEDYYSQWGNKAFVRQNRFSKPLGIFCSYSHIWPLSLMSG